MVSDDSGDAHQAQADRPGLPGAGGSVGHGEQLGEDQQAGGPGPRSGTRYGSERTPARESGQARCPWHSGYGPRSGLVAGGGPRGRRADLLLCWWRRRSAGSRPRPRSAAGRPGGAALGARLTRIPSGQAVRSTRSAGLSDVRTIPGLSVGVVRGGPGGLGDGVVDLRRVVRQREPHAVGHPGGGPGTQWSPSFLRPRRCAPAPFYRAGGRARPGPVPGG